MDNKTSSSVLSLDRETSGVVTSSHLECERILLDTTKVE